MSSTRDKESGAEDIDGLVAAWHACGEQFTVFVPQQQPAPSTWKPDVGEFDRQGRVNPHFLKRWKYFSRTKDFLHKRSAMYHALEGPTLLFDCLVPKYQPRILN